MTDDNEDQQGLELHQRLELHVCFFFVFIYSTIIYLQIHYAMTTHTTTMSFNHNYHHHHQDDHQQVNDDDMDDG